MMKIELNHDDHSALREFIDAHDDAARGHRPEWMRVMVDGLRHRPCSLTAWRDGQVAGWLPLVETRSFLFGRHLASLPYVNEAGVLAADEAAAEALVEKARAIARRRRVRFVELRNRNPIEHNELTSIRTDKVRMTRVLPDTPEALWSDIPSKVRNQVRKGEKSGLNARWGGERLLDGFYQVFAINMRDLGTPVYPRRLFEAILHHFADDAELCVVDLEGEPVAAALLVHGPDATEVPSASSLREYNKTCANMLMYRHLLDRAIQRGATVFDFGRSTVDGGTFRFKQQWGAEASPTGWQHLTRTRRAKPITPDSGGFSLAVETWKRLPVWLTRLAGPSIVRGIP